MRDSLTFYSILTLSFSHAIQATQITRAAEFYGPDRNKVFGEFHAKRLLARWSGTSHSDGIATCLFILLDGIVFDGLILMSRLEIFAFRRFLFALLIANSSTRRTFL